MNKLRSELTDAEFVFFAAFYELKNEREKESMDRASNKR